MKLPNAERLRIEHTVPGDLNGPSGSAPVLTVWIQEHDQEDVRLVTVRPR